MSALMLSFALFAVPTPQDTATVDDEDIACLLSLATIIAESSEERRKHIIPLLMYYQGRIDGKRPGLDISKDFKRLLAGKTDAEGRQFVNATLKRCSAEMQVVGTRMKALDEALGGAK